ncbi:MAG: ABC transporter permease [Nostocoides sp.]
MTSTPWAVKRRREVKQSWWSDVEIPVAAVAFFMTAAMAAPIPGYVMPTSQVAVIVLCLIGFSRPPARELGPYAVLIGVAILLAGYLAFVSLSYGVPADDWIRRMIRLGANVALVFFIASGRLPMKSMLTGASIGLVLNMPAFALGLTPDRYGGYLTGWLGDKNLAGLWYAAVGLLFLTQIALPRNRALWIVFISGALWWTGSRTSMTAFAVGVLWVSFSGRLPILMRWVAVAGSAWAVSFLEENYAQAGAFADRVGSDDLRARIDAATQAKIDGTGFFGQGLGQAFVHLADLNWFFHNSYWTLRVEGGWPYLVVVAGLTAALGLRLFRGSPGWQVRVVEAATLALLLCATRLGEVFATTSWALVVGYAVKLRLKDYRASDRSDPKLPDAWARIYAKSSPPRRVT